MTQKPQIRVLVVDDFILFRTKLQLSLMEDPDIKVIGCAANAMDALKRIEELEPDVITLDVEMPQLNGIDFLKQLMPKKPIPVIVVSSLPINALDALDAGAVDFIKKPSTEPNAVSHFITELSAKIKVASKAKVRQIPKASSSLIAQLAGSRLKGNEDMVIAIGASTGGTEAIIEVVKNLPETTPGIIIVQHMPANFTTLYAARLNKICKMSAKEAEDFDRVVPGQIIVAAGDFHLQLKKDNKGYYIRSQHGPKVSGHCPSVDVMFESVAACAEKKAIGVILTGMGRDGARGITKMRKQGCYTIGQDKDSCVVYGMPMEAFNMGGIKKQLPVDQIGDEIIYFLTTKNK